MVAPMRGEFNKENTMPSPKKSAAAAPAPAAPVAPAPAPVATKPAGKGGKKAAPVAAAPAAAQAPAAPAAVAPPAPPKEKKLVTPNQHATLSLLCGLSNATDGVSRKEIQEKLGIKTTGYPRLIELGFAEANTVEGKRGELYRATDAGRKWFALNKDLYKEEASE